MRRTFVELLDTNRKSFGILGASRALNGGDFKMGCGDDEDDEQSPASLPKHWGRMQHLQQAQEFNELRRMVMGVVLQRIEAPAPHEKIVLSICIAWMLFLYLIASIPMGEDERKFVVGIAVNINMSFFYGAPLSTIFIVLRTRDSSCIHRRTMIMNTFCAFFFLAFGFGLKDILIIVPNAIGKCQRSL